MKSSGCLHRDTSIGHQLTLCLQWLGPSSLVFCYIFFLNSASHKMNITAKQYQLQTIYIYELISTSHDGRKLHVGSRWRWIKLLASLLVTLFVHLLYWFTSWMLHLFYLVKHKGPSTPSASTPIQNACWKACAFTPSASTSVDRCKCAQNRARFDFERVYARQRT